MSLTPGKQTQRPRVLVLSHDMIGSHMAGPGIRYWEIAHVLAQTCQVTLAAPLRDPAPSPVVNVVPLDLDDPAPCEALIDNTDVILSTGFMLYHFPAIERCEVPWVVDAYIPTPTEGLAQMATRPITEQQQTHAINTNLLRRIFARGDFFICANERQRDLYLGFLAAMGRLTPDLYADDPSARSLIDIVPFGLQAAKPQRTHPVIKGVHASVPSDARVLLWGGGIWDWLDPLTLILALEGLVDHFPDVVAYFPGTRHPYRERVPDMAMRQKALDLGERLGLVGKHLFFGDWMPQAERANYLLEADVGISLHLPGLETRFAFRTRILDYIWAGLPMVVSAGDSLSELVEERGLGYVVRPCDVEATQRALVQLLTESEPRQRRMQAFEAVAKELQWQRVTAPLAAFCAEPHRSTTFGPNFESVAQANTPDPDNNAVHLQDALDRQAELEALVAAYQNGRLMRMMAWLHRQGQRLRGGGHQA